MHVSNESIAIIKFNIVHSTTVLARHVIGCHADGGWGSRMLYNTFLFSIIEVPKISKSIQNDERKLTPYPPPR